MAYASALGGRGTVRPTVRGLWPGARLSRPPKTTDTRGLALLANLLSHPRAHASHPLSPKHPPPPQLHPPPQTVCTYWLRGLFMKGDSCGFLHRFDPARMPVCRTLIKSGR